MDSYKSHELKHKDWCWESEFACNLLYTIMQKETIKTRGERRDQRIKASRYKYISYFDWLWTRIEPGLEFPPGTDRRSRWWTSFRTSLLEILQVEHGRFGTATKCYRLKAGLTQQTENKEYAFPGLFIRQKRRGTRQDGTHPLQICLETRQSVIFNPFRQSPPKAGENSSLRVLKRFPINLR